MSAKNGFQEIVRNETPGRRARFVHCHGHRLHLVLVSVSQKSINITKFFDTEAASVVNAEFEASQKKLYPNAKFESLKPLSDTRWVSREAATNSILQTLSYALEFQP